MPTQITYISPCYSDLFTPSNTRIQFDSPRNCDDISQPSVIDLLVYLLYVSGTHHVLREVHKKKHSRCLKIAAEP